MEDRGVSVVDFENEEWRPVPGCPLELTRWSNQRLLASSFIARGTVIEVSRAILVPITDVLLASGPLKDLIWWPPSAAETCSHQAQEDLSRFKGTYLVQPYQEEYRYALLLTGRGLLYSAGTKAASNVGYAWFGERMACGLLDMVSFVALRDIQEGEELIVALDIAEDGRRIILDDFASPCL